LLNTARIDASGDVAVFGEIAPNRQLSAAELFAQISAWHGHFPHLKRRVARGVLSMARTANDASA
jgi:hypothetical protein